MHAVRTFAAVLLAGLATACADLPTTPDSEEVTVAASGPSTALEPIVVIGICDPELSLDRCGQGGDDCMTSTESPLPVDEFASVSGCGTGTGGGGGSATPSVPPSPTLEGPGAFAGCIASILVLAGTTALMQPLAEGVYTARNEYDSARRMYSAVMANDPSLEMEMLYEHRVAVAKSNYDNAVQSYAGAAGASVLTVIAAVAMCSPALILPTP